LCSSLSSRYWGRGRELGEEKLNGWLNALLLLEVNHF
jgi:hypothetical protein